MGSNGFGVVSVCGRRRVPKPAARMIASIRSIPEFRDNSGQSGQGIRDYGQRTKIRLYGKESSGGGRGDEKKASGAMSFMTSIPIALDATAGGGPPPRLAPRRTGRKDSATRSMDGRKGRNP